MFLWLLFIIFILYLFYVFYIEGQFCLQWNSHTLTTHLSFNVQSTKFIFVYGKFIVLFCILLLILTYMFHMFLINYVISCVFLLSLFFLLHNNNNEIHSSAKWKCSIFSVSTMERKEKKKNYEITQLFPQTILNEYNNNNT